MSASRLNRVMDFKFIEIPRPFIVASVLVHLSIPVFVVVFRVLDMLHLNPFHREPQIHDVYQKYIQVEMVALPDQTMNELEKIDVSTPTADKVTPDTKVDDADAMRLDLERQEKAKEAERRRDEALKASAMEKLEAEARREAALKALEKESKKKRLKLKGNVVAKGTAAAGAVGSPQDQYTALIMEKIRERFTILPFQANKGLTNTVYLEVYPTGRVREKRIERRSGDDIYDKAVLQAIDEAQPLPIPEDLSLLQSGITITFKADDPNHKIR